MKPGKRDRDQLLALYAAGGLEPVEAEEVEALLAGDASATAELESIRGLLDDVREVAPKPDGEPDWQAISASIREACDAPGFGTRIRRRVSAKFALPGLVAAAAAVAIVIGVTRSGDPAARTARIDGGPPAPELAESPPIEIDIDIDVDLADGRPAELEELSDDELAALDESLGDIEPMLATDDSDSEPAQDDSLEVFDEPEYDWVDDLSEEQLERVAAYLADQPG